ncbi:MAG: hypothetical protein KTR14_07865 [Vampirovibrio sp.]|nr:hypothetical protein [Vampirovibrio sp.]
MPSQKPLNPAIQEMGKNSAVPVQVLIVTHDHEIQGLVHVSRRDKEDRRLTQLLNDPDRRFLAITDAKLLSRHKPSSKRNYDFLQIHIDNILLMHPAVESAFKNKTGTQDAAGRFKKFRGKMKDKS